MTSAPLDSKGRFTVFAGPSVGFIHEKHTQINVNLGALPPAFTGETSDSDWKFAGGGTVGLNAKIGKGWTVGATAQIARALKLRLLPPLNDFTILKREPRSHSGGRLDFLLGNAMQECLLEVKSATVTTGEAAQFPDSKSPRSVEHLNALTHATKTGRRAVLVFLIQRDDVEILKINALCDPAFNRAYSRALKAGVEFVAFKHMVTAKGFGAPIMVPVATPHFIR